MGFIYFCITFNFFNKVTFMKRSIIARNIKTGEILFFKSATEAARERGFDESHITKCCRGRRKQHQGYTWAYYLPINTLEETALEKSWTLREDNYIKEHFSSGDLENLLKMLPDRNFKDILCRAHILGIKRKKAQANRITPLDLINDLAEDILFSI